MKKFLSILSIIILVVVAGCSSSESSSGGSEGDATIEIDFPTKPLELIIPYSAGGGTDSVGRSIATAAEKHLGDDASIGVVNRTGGGGAVGMTEGANANNDGYTMTMLTVEVTMLPHLELTETTYEDFTPIAEFNFDPLLSSLLLMLLMIQSRNLLNMQKRLRVKSVSAMVALELQDIYLHSQWRKQLKQNIIMFHLKGVHRQRQHF